MTPDNDPKRATHTGTQPAGSAGGRKPTASSAELVHEARKAIKRMRALTLLLHDELGEREFERVDGSLRAAGRRLSGARDAEVRLATLRRLSSKHPNALALEGIERLHERLRSEREQAGEPADVRAVLADIANMRDHLARWNLLEHDTSARAPGLRRIYREGRRRFARVRRSHARSPEDLHDWRKRVKSLYYALDMLGGTQARGARGATRRAERLGETIGEEHDLWMLTTYVQECPHVFGGDDAARKVLLKLTEQQRRRLRKRALRLGARLYRRKPSRFTRRVGDSLTR